MANMFITSDTHFSHELMVKLRGFTSAKEMDDCMVERWNTVVKPQDHVYHLGDVAMRKEHLVIVRRLNGHKRLVMGNHDIFEAKYYFNAGFQKIMALRVLNNWIFSHVPIHPNSLGRFKGNIHGHTHNDLVKIGGKDSSTDLRYRNACVERRLFTPVSLEIITKDL